MQEGVDCAKCLNMLHQQHGATGASGGGVVKATDKQTGTTINGKAIFIWDWEMFCTNSMLDVSLSAASANAHGVILGNSRDMTMTHSGGIAQGQSGSGTTTIEMNSSVRALSFVFVFLFASTSLTSSSFVVVCCLLLFVVCCLLFVVDIYIHDIRFPCLMLPERMPIV